MDTLKTWGVFFLLISVLLFPFLGVVAVAHATVTTYPQEGGLPCQGEFENEAWALVCQAENDPTVACRVHQDWDLHMQLPPGEAFGASIPIESPPPKCSTVEGTWGVLCAHVVKSDGDGVFLPPFAPEVCWSVLKCTYTPCTTEQCTRCTLPGFGCNTPAAPKYCDDGNACTTGDMCSYGVCLGTPNTCNDKNPCTNDSCNPTSGCVNTPTCNDNNPCTTDSCDPATGACAHTWDVCEDGNPCTSDWCDGNGVCAHFDKSAAECNDGIACTVDTCNPAIGCITAPIGDCDDGNPCTDDWCNPNTGCVNTPNGARCDDGNACTTVDICASGTCQPGEPTICNDGNACTLDWCFSKLGCLHPPIVVSRCDDGNPCTTRDICSLGICAGTRPTICNDGIACTVDSCNPDIGCVTAPTGNCDDGNPCTNNWCNPNTGCVNAPNTTSCEDGDVCTVGDVCSGGVCQGGAAVDCNDNNECTTDTCNSVTGCTHIVNKDCDDGNVCTNDSCNPNTGCVNAPNTTSCEDGDACTVADVCGGGVCQGGAPTDCDDNDDCTTDTCDPVTGCVYTNNRDCTEIPCTNDADCNDGNTCTTDSCLTGLCQHENVVCNEDGNPCSIEECDPQSGCGAPEFPLTPLPSCDDGNACTVGDFCTKTPAFLVPVLGVHYCASGSPAQCGAGQTCDVLFGCAGP